MAISGAIVEGDKRNAKRQKQTQRRIDQRVQLGETTATDALEETNVLELADGASEETEREAVRKPGEHKPGQAKRKENNADRDGQCGVHGP